MKHAHLSNAAYNILEYIAQPACMLIAAPILVRHLGIAPYGLWLIASAVAGAGGVVSSGFGDAIVQRVASLTASGDLEGIRRILRAMLAINLLLGILCAIAVWLLSPAIASRLAHTDPALYTVCLWSLRISAPLIAIKAIESVFVSAQKAYQRYAPAVRISVATRIVTIAACVVLALLGRGILALLLTTTALAAIGAAIQGAVVQVHLGAGSMRPRFDRATSAHLLSFGGFTWLQALSGILFSQADRLILGAALGPAAVAYYGVSIQLAQPIHGLTSAGLHLLFPYLAAHATAGTLESIRKPVWTAFLANLLSASILTALVLLLGPRILARWMGASFAAHTTSLLPLIAIGFGFLALNVTAHYSLMALGHVRIVTGLNVAGGLLMLFTMTTLIRLHGAQGAALARLWYGPVTCLLYLPLFALLRTAPHTGVALPRQEAEQG